MGSTNTRTGIKAFEKEREEEAKNFAFFRRYSISIQIDPGAFVTRTGSLRTLAQPAPPALSQWLLDTEKELKK